MTRKRKREWEDDAPIRKIKVKTTLEEYVKGRDAHWALWERYTRLGNYLRASAQLKRMLRAIVKHVINTHFLEQVCGNIHWKNIVFVNNDLDNPIFENQTGLGTRQRDFKALHRMVEKIIVTTRCDYYVDCETKHFLHMLDDPDRNPLYVLNHFLFKTPLERSAFFLRLYNKGRNYFHTRPKVGMGIANSLWNVIPESESKSLLWRVLKQGKWDFEPDIMNAPVSQQEEFQANLEGGMYGILFYDDVVFLRHYFGHGFEIRSNVTERSLEKELFTYFPKLMEFVYGVLIKLGVIQYYW